MQATPAGRRELCAWASSSTAHLRTSRALAQHQRATVGSILQGRGGAALRAVRLLSILAASTPPGGPLLDPVDDAPCSVAPARGRAFAEEVVVLTRGKHEFCGRLARAHQADEHLFGLALGAALVLLALEEKDRRGRCLDVLQRRELARATTVEARRAVDIHRIGVVAAVRSPVVGLDVADRRHHPGGLEDLGVTDRPG